MRVVRVEGTVDGTSYTVLSARIERRLSEVGFAECEVTDEARGPDPGALIGKPAEIAMLRDDGSSETRFAGIVVEARHHGENTPRPFVRLRIASRLWRLDKRTDVRVFQDMNVEAIVRDLLERAGLTDQDWQLGGSYEPRSYCVQHRESDLEFIRRLMSEEGIFFCAESRDGTETIVCCDGDLGPVEGASTLPYVAEMGAHSSDDCVVAVEQTLAVVSDKAVLRDYDFERPDFELKGERESSDEGAKSLEIYVFPARTNQESLAEQRAKVLLESLQSGRDRVSGESFALHLAPGRRFTLENHPYAPLNREYLVLEVEHRWRAERWGAGDEQALGCRFVALPIDKGPYRPPRVERARAMAGYDSARVVGPAGSEIHPDAYGRVKAQPIWDRQGDGSDKASTWMRTFQMPLGGGLLTPRVGWEVTLQNQEGDPDQPMVTGRMYTKKAPPPYALPEHKTRSVIQTCTSPGGDGVNELYFDDKKGSEEMRMNASKNMSVAAGNNATETIGGNELRNIGSNQEVDVTGAASAVSATQLWNVGGSEKLGVSTYMVDQNGGAHTLTIGGNRDLTIGGDHRRLVGGASSLSVGGMQVDLVAGHVTDSTTATLSDTIGAALVELAGGGRNVVCADRVESVGAVKAVLASGGRGVEVGGAMTHSVAGAIAIKTKGALNDNSKGTYTCVAGGAQLIKAVNVTFTAKSLLTVICGGSTLTLTPGSVTLAGATIKLDGVAPETAALVKDN